MTRDQIEAWLALEGWVPFRAGHYFASPGVFRGSGWCFTHGRVPVYNPAIATHVTHNLREGAAGFDVLSDAALQIIYQEIIKHETH